MSHQTEITICLGSSCFSRGNGKTLKVVEDYLEKNNLKAKVFFHGDLCTNNCDKGPIIKINDTVYTGITADNVTEVLKKHFE